MPIELMPDTKSNLWNFGEVKKGLLEKTFKSDVETSYVMKMAANNISVLQKAIVEKPYYTCDGKPVETMEEVMEYNQYYYDTMMKSASEKQKRK